SLSLFSFLVLLRPPPISSLFPYTTLFRSDGFFSTMGVHNSQLLWPSYHQARIMGHCQALQLTVSANIEQQLWTEIRQFAATINEDRKSTRLNSSHVSISYAVFCLKKKKTN